MKKLILLALFSAFLQLSYGQIKSATIIYSMDYSVDDETEDSQDVGAFFEGSNMNIAFNQENIRTDINFGMFMNMSVIANSTDQNGMILLSTFGVSYAVPATLDQIMEADGESADKPEIQLVAGTKKILKYKCKKALQIDADGNITTVWYTQKLKAPVFYFGMAQDIPGVPLEIESNNQGIRIVFTATEIKKGDPDSELFKLEVPEGYEEMSYEEFSTMGEDEE